MYSKELQKYIPPEFNLNNYNKSANINLKTWVINILARMVFYKLYEFDIDPFQYENVERSDIDNFIAFSEISISDGVIELDEGMDELINKLIDMDKAMYLSQVRELTYFELFNLSDSLKTEALSREYQQTKSTVIPSLAMLFQNSLGILNDTVTLNDKFWSDDSVLLKVDLSCSDSEIKMAFSDWLKEKRKHKAVKETKRRSYQLKKLNNVTFRKWYDARILAYLDLVSWNHLQGNRLTSKVIGDILFPSEGELRDTTSLINDTVKPLSNKLANITTIKRMIRVYVEESRKKIT